MDINKCDGLILVVNTCLPSEGVSVIGYFGVSVIGFFCADYGVFRDGDFGGFRDEYEFKDRERLGMKD